MKNNRFICRTIVKNLPLFLIWGALSFTSHKVNAQHFTAFHQEGNSDYFINVNWAATNPLYNNCACNYGFNPVNISFSNWPTGNGTNDNIFNAGFGDSFSGVSSFEIGPARHYPTNGSLTWNGGNNYNPATFSCASQCNHVAFASPFEGVTDLPYPPANITANYDNSGGCTFNWTIATDIPANLRATGIRTGPNVYLSDANFYTFNCVTPGETFEFFTIFNGAVADSNYILTGDTVFFVIPDPRPTIPQPSGQIKGKITTLNGNQNVPGVTVTAELQNPEEIHNGFCWPLTYTTVTHGVGNYTISNIWWGNTTDTAEYVVTPSLFENEFEPDSLVVTLDQNDHTLTGIDFKDKTSYSVTGTISDIYNCGLAGVQLSATGSGFSQPVMSESTGDYTLNISGLGEHTIIASFNGEEIGSQLVDLDGNISGINFTYTETDTIQGFIGAGCQEYIGQFTLDVISPNNGCVIKQITTDENGYYLDTIPSRPIEVQISGYAPAAGSGLDSLTVASSIDSLYEIELDSNTTLEIVYHRPLVLEFEGLPGPPCAAIPYTVLDQDDSYIVAIYIWELLDDCLADTGFISIINDVATRSTESPFLDTIPISNGLALYQIIPGDPALASPFVKNISFTAHVENQQSTLDIPIVVSGSRLRTETIVSTPSDSLPLLILRDPPGDASYGFWEQTNNLEYTQSYSFGVGGDINIWAKGKFGYEGFGLKAWGIIGGGVTFGGSYQNSTDATVHVGYTTQIETSNSPSFIGSEADLVMGAAINFKYGLADERLFDINTCSIVKDTTLFFSPDTFSSTYIHPVSFIKSTTIPNLKIIANNPDTTEDVRRKFRNKIKIWEQIIQLNEELKEEALASPDAQIYDLASGGNTTQSITGRSTRTASYEFSTFLNAQIVAEAGVEFMGSGGSAGVEVNIRSNFGGSESNSETIETTTGYRFEDGDPGDNIIYKYAIDSVFGTPVFGVIGGGTSCPHEEGTAFVNLPVLTFSNPVQTDIVGNHAFFDFTVTNASEFGPGPNEYYIDFVEQSNSGAQVFINESTDRVLITLNQGQSYSSVIRVTRLDGSPFYTFEGLQFEVYPACFASGIAMPDKSVIKTGFISAYFENTCSEITLTSVPENYVINASSNDLMPVTMANYSSVGTDYIRLLYMKAGSNIWQNSNIHILGGDLQPAPQTYNWDISALVDGTYSIRWELGCSGTKNRSLRKSGIIDRSPPQVFGNEKPHDDVYFSNDEISVQFDEPINFNTMSNSDVYLQKVPQGDNIPAQLIIDNSNVIVVPLIDISGMYNQAIEVGVINAQDMFGNIRADTVTWQFIVNEPDADRDKVGDLTDRCPGGNDLEDSDMDGLPDDCDCLPTIPLNGRTLTKAAMDFDGVDDHITFDSAYANVTNNFTYEFWVNPKDTIRTGMVEINNGVVPNFTDSFPHAIFPIQGFYVYGEGQATTGIAVGKNGIIVFEHFDFSFSSNLVHYMPIKNWTHIAVVYTNKQPALYVNGQFIKLGLTSTADDVHPSSYLGGYSWGANSPAFFKGKMDEVRYWNYSLSQSEIQTRMHEELEANEAGLITYFDFNEGTPFGHNEDLSEIVDKSTNGYNGAMHGFIKSGTTSNWITIPITALNVPYAPCINCPDTLNAALDFDGANDYVSIPNDPALIPTTSNPLTIEAWINPADLTGFRAIANSANSLTFYNFSFHLNNGQVLATSQNGQVFTSVDTVPKNIWSHVAVVFNPGSARTSLYINGVLDSEFENAGFGGSNFGFDIQLGDINGGDWYFDGKMDDVRFWDHARTATEISKNMFVEMLGNEAGLAAYFDFNEGDPFEDNTALNTIVDVSGNGNHGALINFRKTGGYSNWVKSPLNFRIDADEDGRPDVCDTCIPPIELILENQSLNGMYMARDKITLGNGITFPANANVLFRTPLLELFESVNAPAGVEVLVNPVPCEEN